MSREQCRIVSELDALQEEVDALRRLQAETAAELNGLLPSILGKAFRVNYDECSSRLFISAFSLYTSSFHARLPAILDHAFKGEP